MTDKITIEYVRPEGLPEDPKEWERLAGGAS